MFKLEHPPKHEGRKMYDYYPTPGWCTKLLLENYPPPLDVGRYVLEPSAGDGAIARVVREWNENVRIVGVEIQEKFEPDLRKSCTHVYIDDYFHYASEHQYAFGACIIGNPPYSLALNFCMGGMLQGVEYMAMLLRIDFLGSQERMHFHNSFPVTQLIVLGKRPEFKIDGKTDLYNYAWFVWDRRFVNGTYKPMPYKPPIVVLP